jgi:hypothetical protein
LWLTTPCGRVARSWYTEHWLHFSFPSFNKLVTGAQISHAVNGFVMDCKIPRTLTYKVIFLPFINSSVQFNTLVSDVQTELIAWSPLWQTAMVQLRRTIRIFEILIFISSSSSSLSVALQPRPGLGPPYGFSWWFRYERCGVISPTINLVLVILIRPSETSSSNYQRLSWRSRETRVRNGRWILSTSTYRARRVL